MNPLHMWVLYEHPADFPDECVARLFIGGIATDTCIRGDSVWYLRVVIVHNYPGLMRVPPDGSDPPEVVEIWM